jgi:hypothetical protein
MNPVHLIGIGAWAPEQTPAAILVNQAGVPRRRSVVGAGDTPVVTKPVGIAIALGCSAVVLGYAAYLRFGGR